MKHFTQRGRCRRAPVGGFTLVEVMIVVAVVGVIALLLRPSVGELDAQRAREAAELLMADLEFAQLRSVSAGEDPFVVVFDDENTGYFVARKSDETAAVSWREGGTPCVRRFGGAGGEALGGVVIVGLVNVTDATVRYTRLGALESAGDAEITLRCGEREVRVVVDAVTGEPRLE